MYHRSRFTTEMAYTDKTVKIQKHKETFNTSNKHTRVTVSDRKK